jgi:hypothetical protein
MSSSILGILSRRVLRHILEAGLCIIASVSEQKKTGRPSRAQAVGNRQVTVSLRLPTLPRMRHRNPLRGLPQVTGADLRDLGPVHACTCGSQVFSIMASFDDFELVWYFLDGTCVNCGNLVKVPCPPDRDETQTFSD